MWSASSERGVARAALAARAVAVVLTASVAVSVGGCDLAMLQQQAARKQRATLEAPNDRRGPSVAEEPNGASLQEEAAPGAAADWLVTSPYEAPDAFADGEVQWAPESPYAPAPYAERLNEGGER